MEFSFAGINDAFVGLLSYFDSPIDWVRSESRNGPVRYCPEPVTIRYDDPLDRVLLYPARDANPFFHVYESLWMLAGRNDVEPLAWYVGRMREFSDDGRTFNGAYGYRWRQADVSDLPEDRYLGDGGWEDGIDQLDILVNHLKDNPTSRRAVLQMWNVEDDLLKVDRSKDVCCNLCAMFAVRRTEDPDPGPTLALDMTVVNRSNDLIWGCLGANYVHFTVLQEYLARRIGVGVGRYHHVTNNLHAYEATFKPEEYLSEPRLNVVGDRIPFDADDDEIRRFVDLGFGPLNTAGRVEWRSRFLWNVAGPLVEAYRLYRTGKGPERIDEALAKLDETTDPYWRAAAVAWLERRRK